VAISELHVVLFVRAVDCGRNNACNGSVRTRRDEEQVRVPCRGKSPRLKRQETRKKADDQTDVEMGGDHDSRRMSRGVPRGAVEHAGLAPQKVLDR
jgi:hypothetical protein